MKSFFWPYLCLSNHCINIKNYSRKHISHHTPHHFLTDSVVVVCANHDSSSLPHVVLFPYSSYTSQILLLIWLSTHHNFLWQLYLLYITHLCWPLTFFSKVPQYDVFILVFCQWVSALLCFPLTAPAVLRSMLFLLFSRSHLGMYQNAAGAAWIAQQLLAISLQMSCITCN
jgi:hypothetical protein